MDAIAEIVQNYQKAKLEEIKQKEKEKDKHVAACKYLYEELLPSLFKNKPASCCITFYSTPAGSLIYQEDISDSQYIKTEQRITNKVLKDVIAKQKYDLAKIDIECKTHNSTDYTFNSLKSDIQASELNDMANDFISTVIVPEISRIYNMLHGGIMEERTAYRAAASYSLKKTDIGVELIIADDLCFLVYFKPKNNAFAIRPLSISPEIAKSAVGIATYYGLNVRSVPADQADNAHDMLPYTTLQRFVFEAKFKEPEDSDL